MLKSILALTMAGFASAVANKTAGIHAALDILILE
jgi:hypothetical protein